MPFRLRFAVPLYIPAGANAKSLGKAISYQSSYNASRLPAMVVRRQTTRKCRVVWRDDSHSSLTKPMESDPSPKQVPADTNRRHRFILHRDYIQVRFLDRQGR